MPEGRRFAELWVAAWIGLEALPPQAGSHRLIAGSCLARLGLRWPGASTGE
jgi:hypothetical protein